MKNLGLEELLKLRLVCSSWKAMVDDYFSKQKSLCLFVGCFYEESLKDIALLKANYEFKNGFVIKRRFYKKPRKNKKFEKTIVKLFPNIQELCLGMEGVGSVSGPYPEVGYLLSKWINMKKLLLNGFNSVRLMNAYEVLDDLKSLETLVVLDYNYENHWIPMKLMKQPFFKQLKHLFIPTVAWLEDTTKCSNLTSLGFIQFGFDVFSPGIKMKFFKNILNFYCLVDLDSGTHFNDLLLFLSKLSRVSKNMVSFGFDFQVCFCICFDLYLYAILMKFYSRKYLKKKGNILYIRRFSWNWAILTNSKKSQQALILEICCIIFILE